MCGVRLSYTVSRGIITTATESTDAIDAAIQSAESLFASLLDRASVTQAMAAEAQQQDPEHSLSPGQQPLTSPLSPSESALQSIGALSLGPAHLSAQAHAAEPLLEGIDPRESLSLLVSRLSVTDMAQLPNYDTVYKMLREREKDLEVAARVGQTLLRRNELLDKDLTTAHDLKQQYEQQVAQLKHDMVQKDELLQLYATDAREREGQLSTECDQEESPEWVRVLTEECKDLRESNLLLRVEADKLRRETADVEQKERDLVQQCLEQFTEAKQRLSELREEAELKSDENASLQNKLQDVSVLYEEQLTKYQQLMDDREILREHLSEAHDSHSHLANEVSELQEKYDECSLMLKEAQEEIQTMKEASVQSNSQSGTNVEQLPGTVEQESIVKEIEEALRKEIIAATTLPERPRSPNHYARQRTMVVMETVRAATLATAQRLERLKAEAERLKAQGGGEGGGGQATPHTHQGTPKTSQVGTMAFSPIAASSPATEQSRLAFRSISTSATATSPPPPPPPVPSVSIRRPSSPVYSDEAGSTVSLPDEFIRYRYHPFMAPEKLQIVKPLEGSVTLLRWKLLATPQLGGAKAFFSNASRPGVNLKGWKAAGIVDEGVPPREAKNILHAATYGDLRQKSLSTMDLSSTGVGGSLSPSRKRHSRRERSIRTKATQLSVTVGGESGLGMNELKELLPEGGGHKTTGGGGREQRTVESLDTSSQRQTDGSPGNTEHRSDRSSGGSLLGHVGSFLGFSRFRSSQRTELPNASTEERSEAMSDTGLAGIL